MVETVFFTGLKYSPHTCAIKDAKLEDAGRWRCEIESYARGKYRGYGYNVTSEFDIKFIPKATTPTAAKTKPSQGKLHQSLSNKVLYTMFLWAKNE